MLTIMVISSSKEERKRYITYAAGEPDREKKKQENEVEQGNPAGYPEGSEVKQ